MMELYIAEKSTIYLIAYLHYPIICNKILT